MTQRSATSPKVSAVLGPTNTGKTFFAIERMLAHRSGMIGLPLRLLAREVYDRIVRLKGPNEIALITGEEKIVPKGARFYICTVEAMALEIEVGCLVVDEIQLAADPERGHVFTDRLLHARGQEETMFLGAESMRGAIQRFIPRAWFITRPRFSDLAYTGAKKLTRLPRRSAVVGFSAEDVYGIAEIVRRFRPVPAMHRSHFINPAKWISWSPPTPSAWASTWMWTMWPSPERRNLMAGAFAH
jgi:ATP-dependent RNA helicase SUPV3L1/SUV3